MQVNRGGTNVQAGGKPHDRQVNQSADSVITQFPGLGAVGAVPLDSDRGGASMMVQVPASAVPVIVKPMSAVRQMVSATRLPRGCTVGSWFG
ncbi:hypothetical protein, partial [Corynebacterium sp. HMSC28B08]|uniref:hypothetical protein n=1 Tax=Corynebacterium sp. HMSC28B08 TaxID=1581066 RepID=UPI001FEE26DA